MLSCEKWDGEDWSINEKYEEFNENSTFHSHAQRTYVCTSSREVNRPEEGNELNK